MGLEYYFEKAVIGINGGWFYFSYYGGEKFLSKVGKEFILFSSEPINKDSEKYRNIFITRTHVENLDNVTRAKMFIKYMGNEYEAIIVDEGFSRVVLKARKGLEYIDEDEKLGFEYDSNEGVTWKTISKDDIEDIRIEEISVYEEFLKKYGSR